LTLRCRQFLEVQVPEIGTEILLNLGLSLTSGKREGYSLNASTGGFDIPSCPAQATRLVQN
jgi:hypothetical protein